MNISDKKIFALLSKTLYDKGVAVLTRRSDKDISGRPLSLINAKADTLLYGEIVSYVGNSGRLAQAEQRWLAGGQETVHSTGYSYDALGRLSEAAGALGGQYGYFRRERALRGVQEILIL